MVDRRIHTNRAITDTGVRTLVALDIAPVPGRRNEGIVDHALDLLEGAGQNPALIHHVDLAEVSPSHQENKIAILDPEVLVEKDLLPDPHHVLNQVQNRGSLAPSLILGQGPL